jgi:tellurite resistance protein TerC
MTLDPDILSPLLATGLLGTPLWQWLVFAAVVIILLVLDLGVLHREERAIGVGESLALSAGYITAGLAFGAWVWSLQGADRGLEYLTGFMVEKSLSMDNVFVMALIFGHLAIPPALQHRVLFWGIVGVIVLRAILIGLGSALVTEAAWVLYLFGAFLVVTGVKMCMAGDHQPDIANNPLLRFLRARLRLTTGLHGPAFFVRQPVLPGTPPVLHATPLFVALLLVEAADLVFAVDSVPAIFAITNDPFVVYTSNIFAILGLRALYFALAALIERFRYLKYALAAVLVFIGGKIFLVGLIGKIPPVISLSVTFGLIASGIVYSLWKTRGEARGGAPAA